MAIKRFDDIDKKARELEAQAKKLRREKQAAKTKAYAHGNGGNPSDGDPNAVVREPAGDADSPDGDRGSLGVEGFNPERRPFD